MAVDVRTRRPVRDQLAAAAARHPVVVLVAPRGDATRRLVEELITGTTWRDVRSLGDDATYAAARTDQLGFARHLPGRSVVVDADAITGLPSVLAAAVADRGTALPGQLLLTVSARDHAPSGLAPDAVLYVRPLSLSERLGDGQACIAALFDAEPTAWTAHPLTDAHYLSILLEHQHSSDDVDDLDALELATLRAVQRRSGSWFERAGLGAVLGVPGREAQRTVERLVQRGHLRRLVPVHGHGGGQPAGDPEGPALGRLVATDAAAVARAYSLGGAAVDPTAVAGDVRLALTRTAALSELLTHNEWLRRPCTAATWHAARDNEQVDLVLTRPDGRSVAVSVAATARVDDEAAQAALASLQALRRRHPGLGARLVLLYLGPAVLPLGRDLFAVPLSMLWSALPAATSLGYGDFEDELSDAFGRLSLLCGTSGLDADAVAAQREQARAFLGDELAPMLELTVERLADYGLDVAFDAARDLDAGDLATAGAGAAVLPATTPDVLAAARVQLAVPGLDGQRWDAVLVAAATRSGPRWWVGQVLDGGTVMGRSGPLSGRDAADADHLLAAVVAGLVDTAGHLAQRA